MPFYEYQCRACQHQFEAMQKISDPALMTCPVCHQDELTKLVSSPAFQLKGEGWYVTDFKNKKEAKPADKKEGDATPASASTASKDSTTTGESK